jgi:hypothetical protein
MRTWMNGAVALSIGAIGSFVVAPADAGDGVTWMREHVQQRQMARMQRFLARQTSAAPINPSIVGGNIAPTKRWPAQVALLDASIANNYDAQFCGGSLIGPRHVLTAAHCVDFLTKASQLHVLTGTSSLANGGTRQGVASFKIHPFWNDTTFDYDIAVVALKTTVVGIRPLELLTRSQEIALAGRGKEPTSPGGVTRAPVFRPNSMRCGFRWSRARPAMAQLPTMETSQSA